MNIDIARERAAEAWDDKTMENKEMDVALCEVFAKILLNAYIEGAAKGFGNGYAACAESDFADVD